MYDHDELIHGYRSVGVTEGSTVLLKSDVRYLGEFVESGRVALLDAHYNALAEIIDLSKGTLVVSTASSYLCNTSQPFDVKNTKTERGVLSEFIRKKPGAIRSMHPFASLAAIGRNASYICSDVSRHAYGLETPKARMLDLDARYVSVGLTPNLTCSYIHHVEMMMGVPYRYTKEFVHPVVLDSNEVVHEEFYLFCANLEVDIHRDVNHKLFDYYYANGGEVLKAKVGKGNLFGYSCVEFCELAAKFLRKDIYGWLRQPPVNRPYRR